MVSIAVVDNAVWLWLMQLPKSRIPISNRIRLVSYTNTQTTASLTIHSGSESELLKPNQSALTSIGLVIEVPLNSWAEKSVVCMGSNGLGLYRVQSMADFALPAGSFLLQYCSYNSYKYMCKGQFYKYKYTGKYKSEYCIKVNQWIIS